MPLAHGRLDGVENDVPIFFIKTQGPGSSEANQLDTASVVSEPSKKKSKKDKNQIPPEKLTSLISTMKSIARCAIHLEDLFVVCPAH